VDAKRIIQELLDAKAPVIDIDATNVKEFFGSSTTWWEGTVLVNGTEYPVECTDRDMSGIAFLEGGAMDAVANILKSMGFTPDGATEQTPDGVPDSYDLYCDAESVVHENIEAGSHTIFKLNEKTRELELVYSEEKNPNAKEADDNHDSMFEPPKGWHKKWD
jgi:hypothetical protein